MAETIEVSTAVEIQHPDPDPADMRAETMLSALGQQTRLKIFRLLVRNEPCGLTVGAIAQSIQCPQNTTSSHLAILARSQLAINLRQGRSVIYRADFAGMRWLVEYLLADCCDGDATLCAPFFAALCIGGCAQTGSSEAFAKPVPTWPAAAST